jgi:mRNA interferase MazF
VLVVSDDALNARGLVVTVVVGTDARNVERRYSTNVLVPASESGLPRDTVFLCFQVRSLDPQRFVDPSRGAARRTGSLPPARMAEVDRALRLSLGL